MKLHLIFLFWLCGIAEIRGHLLPRFPYFRQGHTPFIAATDVQDNEEKGCELDCRLILLDKKIVFKTSEKSELKDYTEYHETRLEKKLVGTFIMYSYYNRYVLYCFERGTSYVATLALPDGKHVVTIGGFDCSTRERLDETSYVLLKKIPGQTNVLRFGINPNAKPNKWCRFDICPDCTDDKVKCIGGFGRSRPIIQDGLFQWSEKGMKINNELQLGSSHVLSPIYAVYKNSGYQQLEFVYTCYMDNNEIITSLKGKLIIAFKREDTDPFRCSQGFLIQDFRIFEIKKKTGDFYEFVNVYQSSNANKMGDDQSWYYGGKNLVSDRKEWMAYHSVEKISRRFPFWRPIYKRDLNMCPSLARETMIGNSLKFEELHKTYTLSPVAYYKNKVETHFLTCFRAEDKLDRQSRPIQKHFILVTDKNGGYVVTVENEDCSSDRSFDKRLFLETSSGDENVKGNVLGFRKSIRNDWCTYIMYRIAKPYTARMQNVTVVYYDYKPKDDVLQWIKADSPPQCPELPFKSIVVDYKEPPMNTLSGRYLLRTRGPKSYRYYLLDCYPAQDGATGDVNVFKTTEGKKIMSIIGQDCLYTKTKNKLFYLAPKKIKKDHYLKIGTRTSAEDTWCEYEMCIDCEQKNPKLVYETIPRSSNADISEAGFEWKKGLGPGYDTKTAFKHYVLEGKSDSFGLVCTKLPDKKLKLELMSSKVARIGTIELPRINCNRYDIGGFDFYFLAKDEKTTLYSNDHCRDVGCKVEPGIGWSSKKTWVYYIIQEKYKDVFKAQKEDSCTEVFIARENIRKFRSSDKNIPISTSWNAANPKIQITCYKTLAVVSIEDQGILTLVNYNCYEPISPYNMKDLYIDMVDGDMNHIVIGSRQSTSQSWCGYSLFITYDQIDVQRTYGYKPDDFSTLWYNVESPGCADLPKENIIVNDKSRGNEQEKVDDKQKILKYYVGKHTAKQEYKILYCYEINSKDYTAVIKSVKGNTELTIKGLDCFNERSQRFSMSYSMNRDQRILALFMGDDNSNTWCGYHICLNNCNEPGIPVYVHDRYRDNNKIQWTQLSRIIEASDRSATHSPWYYEPEYRELQSVGRKSFERKIQFRIEAKKPEGYLLLMKFVDYNSKYELNCYIPQNDGGDSFAMLTDEHGNHVVTILKYGCSLQDIAGFTGLKVQNPRANDDVINIKYELPTRTLYIGICLKCVPSFIVTYSPVEDEIPRTSWIMVAPNDCPKPNNNNVQAGKNKIVQNNVPEIRYINTDPHGKGIFTLNCRKDGDGDFVSIFRNQLEMHLVYFKGDSCPSSLKSLTSSPHSIHETITEELIIMGNSESDYCQFILKITRKTDKRVIYENSEYEDIE